ncbi:uncharacterized protein STEHIDRAFT_117330 [Stereum hirsutum FP-91666 SS1]|uniref:uncharacterized protein n=1 Tax=Stereum hirsutum (strain FP-91666) TaxID=721885 RepID=UPI000440DD77|nr:uncharacterized protein STEHIDRAFT_117330 [Stereum hirsutum FP-91666 SS1]EIM92295.1 hypothetical protein STEHIDRAFT_117330 [Stereum hirsutum FP-91666 SS1]
MNGLSGPTAAQVLRAPPPARKDSYRDTSTSSRSQTPESAQPTQPSKPASEVNHAPTSAPLQEPVVNKLPVSFAAVANGAPDAAKEVSVSA